MLYPASLPLYRPSLDAKLLLNRFIVVGHVQYAFADFTFLLMSSSSALTNKCSFLDCEIHKLATGTCFFFFLAYEAELYCFHYVPSPAQ
jgi:hypothetical protein